MVMNGTIESNKISEKLFIYEWHFSRLKKSYLCKSPTFEPIWEEFSTCNFNAIYDRKSEMMVMVLVGNDIQRSQLSFKATLDSRGVIYAKARQHAVRNDINPSCIKFEFSLSYLQYNLCGTFVFALTVEFFGAFIPMPSLLQDIEVNNMGSLVFFDKESNQSTFIDNPHKLVQDLRSLYTSGSMCDLKICIGDEVLRAHKLILCARSPVFMKMMEHDCLESASNSITITDCNVQSFKKFLVYLYTGEIEDTTLDTVMPLYSLGDKYDVPGLREACSMIMQSKLTSESVNDVADIVCDVLQLAECHSNSELKQLAVSFITNHFPLVSNKQSWKELMKSHFELTSEVLALVVTACQKMQT